MLPHLVSRTLPRRLCRCFASTSTAGDDTLYVVSLLGLNQPEHGYYIPDFGPMSTKLTTYLKMASVPFQMVSDPAYKAVVGFENGPTNKLPYAIHKGEKIGDSHFIINYVNKEFDVDLDKNLTAQKKALTTAFTSLLEEQIYWGLIYTRYKEQEWEEVTTKYLFEQQTKLTAEERAEKSALRQHIYDLGVAGGIFRHSEEQITELAHNGFSAVSQLLGDNTFLLGGASPTRLDAVAFGQLNGLIPCPWRHPINDSARSFDNLVRYCSNIKDLFYDKGTPLNHIHIDDVEAHVEKKSMYM